MTDPVHGHDTDRMRLPGWRWRDPARGEHFRRCNYCGSIHPEDLAAEPYWYAEWADRKYGWPHKFYVDIPNRNPGQLYCLSASSGPYATDETHIREGFIPGRKLSRAQRKALTITGMTFEKDNSYTFHYRTMHHAKFYTVHLADPDLLPATRTTIETRSGLHFNFSSDGRVTWQPI